MIIRPDHEGSILIRQRDHAALSECLMRAWRADGFPDRASRATVLGAVREHDNGWLEPDESPMRDPATGLILDFITAPLAVRQDIWPRGIERVERQFGSYGAALVAQHALTILKHHREDPEWSAYFMLLEHLRESHLARAGAASPVSSEVFLRDYAILNLGDLLSLIFCNGWTDSFEGEGYRIRLRGSRLEVWPDPFEGAVVPLRVPGRRVQARQYPSDGELAAAYQRAPPVQVEGEAVGLPLGV